MNNFLFVDLQLSFKNTYYSKIDTDRGINCWKLDKEKFFPLITDACFLGDGIDAQLTTSNLLDEDKFLNIKKALKHYIERKSNQKITIVCLNPTLTLGVLNAFKVIFPYAKQHKLQFDVVRFRNILRSDLLKADSVHVKKYKDYQNIYHPWFAMSHLYPKLEVKGVWYDNVDPTNFTMKSPYTVRYMQFLTSKSKFTSLYTFHPTIHGLLNIFFDDWFFEHPKQTVSIEKHGQVIVNNIYDEIKRFYEEELKPLHPEIYHDIVIPSPLMKFQDLVTYAHNKIRLDDTDESDIEDETIEGSGIKRKRRNDFNIYWFRLLREIELLLRVHGELYTDDLLIKILSTCIECSEEFLVVYLKHPLSLEVDYFSTIAGKKEAYLPFILTDRDAERLFKQTGIATASELMTAVKFAKDQEKLLIKINSCLSSKTNKFTVMYLDAMSVVF